MSKKFVHTLSTLIALGAVFFSGFYLGGNTGNARLTQLEASEVADLNSDFSQTDFTPYWKVWSILSSDFLYADEIDPQEKVWGSTVGLAAAMGDPYTVFFPPEDSKDFEDNLNGEFSGIGVEVEMIDGIVTVVSPLRGSPGEQAGLLPKDAVVGVDGENIVGLTLRQAIERIRGPRGTEVTLTVLREGEQATRDITIVRDVITVPSVETEVVDNVFVLHFYNFSKNTELEFQQALQEFVDGGYTKLVIDLRGNPGGYLDVAIDTISWFLEEGKVIVRESYNDKKEEKVYRSKGYNFISQYPVENIAVLVNRGSASASEIFAGALQDHDIATIYGETTFGKGSVQELVPITKDTSLKVTVSKWLTPDGTSISAGGLAPDVQTNITLEDEDYTHDAQLQELIDLLQ